MRALYRALYPFFRCRVNIPKELADSGEPVVFIANHYNVFGPLSFMISMPAVTRFWGIEEMVNQESAAKAMDPGMRQMFPFLGDRQIAWLCEKLGTLAVRVLNNLGAIPVSREKPGKMLSTMRQSMAALEAGENLLIFPETGDPEYSLTSVTPFFSGFAALGRLYHRKTGKCLRFCPCYIDEQHHQIRLGEIVTWNPEADPNEETERISDETNRIIREMAAENRGVEKTETKPARQTILFFTNLARFLLLIPLYIMMGLPNPGMVLTLYCVSQGLRILFNAVGSTFSASNRLSFRLAHEIGILTDLGMLIYLNNAAVGRRGLVWLAAALGVNGLVITVSNLWAQFRFHRCAGTNYFDTVSANLLMAINLLLLLKIRLPGPIWGILLFAELITLAFSTGFSVAFNARIGRETERDGRLAP